MKITKDIVRYVADLARISLTTEEEALFTGQLNDILAYMDKLNRLDIKTIQPMSHPLSRLNVFREDKVKESLSQDEALKNAPNKEGDFFKVPKII